MNENSSKLKHKWAKRFFLFVIFLIAAYAVFLFGYINGQKGNTIGIAPKSIVGISVTNTEVGKPSGLDFSLFWEAWNKLKEKSVHDVEGQKMLQGAISGMLSSLNDPYTVFFTKEENKRFREDIQGEFSGIGIEIVQKDGMPTVVAPISGAPADKAGLKPNDVIFEVDGTKTADLGFEETINKIRGEKGTSVKLKILRKNSSDPIEFSVTRDIITVKSVEWSLKESRGKKIEYIKLRQFGDDTESLFSNAADDVLKNKPDDIILDLRNDPGGYLETAVNIASYFIDNGVVVSEKGKNDNKKDYSAKGNAKLGSYKVTLLVDQGSASASEILAGALRDRKGSKLVGDKTYGKGSVQELIELSDGSAVKITVAKWYTPSGQEINGKGLEPDIKVQEDKNSSSDEQLDRAIEFLSTGK